MPVTYYENCMVIALALVEVCCSVFRAAHITVCYVEPLGSDSNKVYSDSDSTELRDLGPEGPDRVKSERLQPVHRLLTEAGVPRGSGGDLISLAK